MWFFSGKIFVKNERGGGGIERLEHRGPQRRYGHTDLEAFVVAGASDRLGRGRGLAEAVVPNLLERNDVGLGYFLPNVGAEIAVHGLPDRGIIRERKTHSID